MTQPASNYSPPPPPNYGTSLIDRTNIAIYLRRYLKLFFRRWWILVICVLAALAFSMLKANTTPDAYEATSKLVIKPRTETATGSVRIREDDYNDNQLLYIKSQPVLGRVREQMQRYVSKSGLAPKLTRPPKAEHGQGATFLLTVESNDFDYSREYVQTWVKEFLKFKTNLLNQVMTTQSSALRSAIATQKEEQTSVETALNELLRTNRVVSVNDITAAQATYERLVSEYQTMTNHIFLLEHTSTEQLAREDILPKIKKSTESKSSASEKPSNGKESSSETEARDPSDKFSTGSSYTKLISELRGKSNELARLSLSLKPAHPAIKKVQEDIRKLQGDIAIELSLIDERRNSETGNLIVKASTYPALIADKKADVMRLQAVKADYDKLKQRETTISQTLQSLEKDLRELEMSTAVKEEFYPLEDGLGSGQPISRRQKIILTGLLFGFLIGLAIVYFLQRLDDRLELAEEIEAELEEPVLGQIPQVDKKTLKEGLLLLTQLEPHSMYAESLRGVRSAVMFGSKGAPKQTIMITSALPGDGKTSFTVNFAITLANAGQRVLLVDADLRRGNISNYFGLSRDPGLAEILAGEEHWADVLGVTPVKNLNLIASGRLAANPGELLLSPVAREFVGEAKHDFDHIIIDCPPLTAIDDTFSLLGIVDGVLFVIRSGQTSMRFAKTGIAAMRQRGAQIMGVVLNGLTADNPAYYYARYYHSYYTKGLPASDSHYAPAKKMAAPRSKRFGIASIETEAKALAGQHASLNSVAKEEQHKADVFKARRAAEK